jgi:hypothetical protein
MVVLGAIAGIAQASGRLPMPTDAWVYWNASLDHLYTSINAYLYPPILAQLIAPLHLVMGWPLFIVGWTAVCFAAFWYVARAWSLPLVLLGFGVALAIDPSARDQPLVKSLTSPLATALTGNVTWVLVAACMVGIRRPTAWILPLLAKLTPGIGLLWQVFRGDWAGVRRAIGCVLAISAVSFVIAPQVWLEYVAFAAAHLGSQATGIPIVGPPLLWRVPVAIALIWWAARTDRAWMVPAACALATIGLFGLGTLIPYCLASLTLWRRGRSAVDEATSADHVPSWSSNGELIGRTSASSSG